MLFASFNPLVAGSNPARPTTRLQSPVFQRKRGFFAFEGLLLQTLAVAAVSSACRFRIGLLYFASRHAQSYQIQYMVQFDAVVAEQVMVAFRGGTPVNRCSIMVALLGPVW